jgi:hypothetical protein
LGAAMKSITLGSSSAERIGQLVRLLGSNQDGEVVDAARAINRTLASNGTDLHHLADVIEHGLQHPALPPPPPPPPDPMDEILDMLNTCMCWLDVFNDYEAKFLKQMHFFAGRDGRAFRMTEKQAAWLRSLYRSKLKERA